MLSVQQIDDHNKGSITQDERVPCCPSTNDHATQKPGCRSVNEMPLREEEVSANVDRRERHKKCTQAPGIGRIPVVLPKVVGSV